MLPLQTVQQKLVTRALALEERYLFTSIDWENRLIGIKGARGTGKTTLLLQYIAKQKNKGLYASADHPYFYTSGFYELAEEFVASGGEVLAFDEVHRFPNWSRELKAIYDSFPELQVLFSSSSALNIFKGEGDLSRRASVYELAGLSFREYLWLSKKRKLESVPFSDVLERHMEITNDLLDGWKPLVDFKNYLECGYFPFGLQLKEAEYHKRLGNTLNTVLDIDLSMIKDYSASNTFKIKQLLGIIAQSVPFQPNISSLARDLGISRDSIYAYLDGLESAKILNFLYPNKKGISALRRPSKIFFENANLNFLWGYTPNVGTLRETFVLNQIINAKHAIKQSLHVDFLVNEEMEIEVGGKKKNYKQFNNEKGFIFSDDIEIGIGNKIPLWLLGFLY